MATLDALPDKVISYLDMLAPVMEYWVLAELDHGLVVHEHGRNRGVRGEQIDIEPLELDCLARRS